MLERLRAAGRALFSEARGSIASVFYVRPTSADVHVDEYNGLKLGAVWFCVNLISGSIASLPKRVYRSDGETRQLLSDDPVDRMIHRAPNPEIPAYHFWLTMTGHALTWGNGYAEIERNRRGEPIALWMIEPDRGGPERNENGRLQYRFNNPAGGETILSPANVFHLRGLGWDGTRGYSPIRMARESIATGMAAEQFAGTFFGNGAMPGAFITSDGTTQIEPEGIKKLLARFNKKHGGPRNKNRLEFLDAGMDIKTLGVDPADAQFLESRQFQAVEIGRWFGVSPYKMGQAQGSTRADAEQEELAFTTETLNQWGQAIVAEIDAKLLTGKRYARIEYRARMRTDVKSRSEYYRNMFYTGAYSPNDILRLEDENPVPGGDQRFVPVNMMRLDQSRSSDSDVPQANDTDQENRGRDLEAFMGKIVDHMHVQASEEKKFDAGA